MFTEDQLYVRRSVSLCGPLVSMNQGQTVPPGCAQTKSRYTHRPQGGP